MNVTRIGQTLVSTLLCLGSLFLPGLCAALDFSGLFGDENHVHPFITLESRGSDNIYDSSGSKRSDMVFYTRPGVWLAAPGADRQVIAVETAAESPGGVTLSRFNDNDDVRYQTYVLYSPEIETYVKNTRHNDINQTVEGYALYNTPGGLSLEFLGQSVSSHDEIEQNLDNIDFKGHYLSPSIAYTPTEKLKFRLDYSLYAVDYERKADVKDRTDRTLSAYGFFDIFPKTSLFFQYVRMDIDYNNSTDPGKSIDSIEQEYLVGVRWDITDKTTGSFKTGYHVKDFSRSIYGDSTTLKLELKADYAVTGRSSVSLTGRNEFIETDEDNAYFIRSNNLLAVYEQAITERISGFFSFFYNHEDYGRLSRKDLTMDFSPSLSYIYNDWLSFNAAYTFETVRSGGRDADEDYSKNTMLISMSATL